MGVVNIKKVYLLVLISVIFISMSLVSATNDINSTNLDSSNDVIQNNSVSTKLITKQVNNNVTKSSTNEIVKTASKISISSIKAEHDSTVKFTAKVTNAKTGAKVTNGKVVFKINGNTLGNSNVKKGTATYTYNITDLTPKTYNITVKYGETSELKSSSANAKLTVTKASSKIVLSNTTVITKDKVKITATVTNKNNGHYVLSGKVAFKLNGKTIGYANVKNGKAVLTYTADLAAKNYKLNATYGGNNNYTSSVSSLKYLTVNKRSAKITASKVSGYSTTVTLKATILDKVTSKNMTSGLVIFKINDKTVGNASISNGKASLKYNTSELARGTYKVTAQLKTTNYYKSCSSSNNLTILSEKSFTYNQIKKAAVYVRTQYESNNVNIISVPISKSRIGLSDFLALMIQATENVKKKKSNNTVSFKQYNTLTTQTDTLKSGVLNISQILDIGNRTLTFMKNNNRPPKYSSTVFGQMGYYNIVYSYCKVLDVSTSKYLPNTCKVYNWASIHPSNPKSRTIYITSDYIKDKTVDHAFMNDIKAALESKGYNVVINGYGPSSHYSAIRAQSLPSNAIQLSIFGGADAGVIYDMCTRNFMRLKENRLMYLVYNPKTSKDITGLSFLERAHDDNYSSSSFKGIANPDLYLKNNGYDYSYSNNVKTIVNNLISYIS